MASLATVSKTKYSLTLNVDGLNSASTYTEVYITCNGVTSSNLARGASGWTYSNSYTFSGLSCGTYYSASYTLLTSAGSTGSGSGGNTTDACQPPSSLTGLSMWATGTTSLSASWSSASGALSYDYVLRTSGGSTVSNGNTSSTSTSFSGLSSGTSYTITVTPRNNDGYGGSSSASATTNTPVPLPSSISFVSISNNGAGSVSVSWGSSANATSYGVEIWSGGSVVAYDYGVTSTSKTFSSGIPSYKSVQAKVYGQNSTGNGSATWSSTITSVDYEAPSLSITGDGNGRIYVSITASDSGIGMRSTNTYYVEISNANGSVYGNSTYTTNTQYSFSTDGEGKPLVNNSLYYVRVTAYDASSNATAKSIQLKYIVTRPPSWEWTTAKVKGGDFNLTATEWNSFCTKINQFRTYKNISQYSFTSAYSSDVFYAYQFNEARNAINSMSPPTSVPSSVASGQEILASMLNALRDSLNSIT